VAWTTGTRNPDASTDGYAVASLVCSIVGFLIALSAILGIVFGIISVRRIGRSRSNTKGEGLAAAGIIVGCIGFAVSMTLAIVVFAHRPAPAASQSVEESGPPAAVALAQTELLSPSAYPSGWEGGGPDTYLRGASLFGGDSPSDLAQMTACLGVGRTGIDSNPGEAAAQEYDDPNSMLMVNDTVDVFSTSRAAALDVAGSANPKNGICLLQTPGPPLAQSIAEGYFDKPKVTGPTMAVQRSLARAGQRDTDLELSFHVNSAVDGVSGAFYLDEVVVQQGRSESNLWIANVGGTPPIGLVNRMAHAAAEQMRAAGQG
jgi:hypothetical protein